MSHKKGARLRVTRIAAEAAIAARQTALASTVCAVCLTPFIPPLTWAADATATGHAAATWRDYDIPAGPLAQSLNQLALQSGVPLSFAPQQVSGRQAPALQGSYTLQAGLDQLLAGTGLVAVTGVDGSIGLQAAGSRRSTSLATVVVTGQHESTDAEQVYRAAQSSVYIPAEQIQRYGVISAGDLLKGQPGIQVGDSRNGGALDVNIRGIQGQSRVAVTIDGGQQALDVYRGYGGTQQRSYIDPTLISSMTISKGPQLEADQGAIAGSVRVETLTPADVLRPGQSLGVRLTSEKWNNGVAAPWRDAHSKVSTPGYTDLYKAPDTRQPNWFNAHAQAGSIAVAGRSDSIDWVAAYARRSQGNYFSGKHGNERYRSYDDKGTERNSVAKAYQAGEEVLNSSASNESVLLKATARFSDAHRLEIGYRHFNGRYGEIMPSDILRSEERSILQYPLSRVTIDSAHVQYRYAAPDSPLLALKGQLWITEAKTDTLTNVVAPTSQFYRTDRHWTRLANRRIGGNLGNTALLDTGLGLFSFSLGSAFELEDLKPQNGVVTTQADRNSMHVLRDAERRSYSFSSKLEYQPTERLKLWTGARLSYNRTQDRNTRAHKRYEEREYREQAFIYKNKETQQTEARHAYWFPDENGHYSDKTDPRLNNAELWGDSNNPFLDTVPYNDITVEREIIDDKPQTRRIVVGFDHERPLHTRQNGFVPSAGLSVDLTDNMLFYASISQGIRTPSLFETSLGTLMVKPGESLRAERARNLELGLAYSGRDLLSTRDSGSIKLAYFNNRFKNYITRYYDPKTYRGAMNFRNADSYTTKGLELQSEYDNGRWFTDFSATYYLKTETCDADFASGLRIPVYAEYLGTKDTPNCTPGSFMGSYTNTQNPPKLALNLTLGHRWFDEKLTLGTRVLYTSGPTVKINRPWQASDTTPQIEYKPVTVVDLFAKYAWNDQVTLNASVTNLSNRFYLDPLAQSLMPAPGRTFRAGMELRF